MIRELLGDFFLIGFAASHTWAFVMIHIQGYAWLQENILWIRYYELSLGIIGVILGVERLINDLRKK